MTNRLSFRCVWRNQASSQLSCGLGFRCAMSRERMKNKKRNETLKSQTESGASHVEHSLNGQATAADKGPSTSVKTWVSIWLVVHLMAIAVSFTAVVQPSSLHRRLSEVLQPYLRPTQLSKCPPPLPDTFVLDPPPRGTKSTVPNEHVRASRPIQSAHQTECQVPEHPLIYGLLPFTSLKNLPHF